MIVEGVPYQRFVVSFKLADGRRRRWVRWSPGWPWIGDEVARELEHRFEDDELPPGSNIYIEAA